MAEGCHVRVSDWRAIRYVGRRTPGLPALILLKPLYKLFVYLKARSAEEVEDYLASLMDQEFDTIVEDGSISQVLIYAYFREIIK